jgi:hypothetical protein
MEKGLFKLTLRKYLEVNIICKYTSSQFGFRKKKFEKIVTLELFFAISPRSLIAYHLTFSNINVCIICICIYI